MYKIPESNLDKLISKLDSLSRKAAKLGCETIGYEIVDETMTYYTDDITGIKTYYKLYTVEVTGTAPSLNGWTFVAKLEHMPEGNVVKGLEEVPEHYRTVEPWCEHCQTNRERINTYLVRKGNEYKQVGSSCLADFTGHPNPQDVAQIAEWICKAIATAEEESYDPDRQPRGKAYYRLENYLSYVALESREHGYISKSKAHESAFGMSTGQIAYGRMVEGKSTPTAKDDEKAKKAIAWIRAQVNENHNQYMYNLILICNADYITYEHMGFAASLIGAYNRAMEQETTRQENPSNWVGEIKKRQMFNNLTVTFTKELEGIYGVTILHKFQDENGNVLVWFATNGTEFEIGDVVSGKATVKKHDEYQEQKQTTINRCKFELVEAQ